MSPAVRLYGVLILTGLSVPAFAQTTPEDPNYQPQPGYQPQPAYQQQPVYRPQPAYQQQPGYPQQQGYPQQPAPDGPRLSPQDLGNLVAPIALYPDLLLSQVLAASTYPAEITQAQQWMQQNPGLRGRQLVDAAKQQPWDPSVQALVAFPDVLNMLTRDMQWTTALGNAFLAQQPDVMDAIQRLRASARNNGRLMNTPQQRVTYEQENGQNAIVIQPTNPQVVYAPVYNPAYVWGPPVYGAYPALNYPDIGTGILYGIGTFLGALFTGLMSFGGWGWGLSWLTHGLFLNGLFFNHFGFHGFGGGGFGGGGFGGGYAARSAWVHNPAHRLGVPYGNRYTSARYGGSFGSRGGYSSQHSSGAGNYAGRSNGSSYAGGSRQMEAYRGLSASSSRAGSAGSSARYSTASNYGGGYRGAGSGFGSGRGWSEPSSHSSASRSSFGGGRSSSHYSAPKASRHSGGGGGHSGGGHSHGGGGGGHSHGGGGHKK